MSGEAGSLKRNSRDSFVYLTTCKIGHLVEAHLKDGSIYSGIFHAADLEKDFGIVLKMASLVKDGTLGGQKSHFVRKTLIIPADELVQVVAKDLSVLGEGKLNAVQSEKSVELLTDSSISKSSHVDKERELKPWVPDEVAPEGLDDVFDESSNRGWDQFTVNEKLFGVKSTFSEEMYTTTLDKGSRTKELEEKALRIASEIRRENTEDLHVAEERGLQVNEKFDTDEEAKYSAVRRVDGFDEEEDKLLDTCNYQTFGGSSTPNVQKPTLSSGKGDGGDSQPSQNIANVDQSCSKSDDHAGQLSNDFPAQGSSTSESQLGERRNNNNLEVAHSNKSPEASVSGYGDIKESENVGGGGTSASKTVAEKERQDSQVSGKPKSESSFGQSASESDPSPSTSTSSLSSSKKFILNPNAKEFKPSHAAAPVRPQAPIAGGPFYHHAPPAQGQQMPRMPAGFGIQPQYPGHEYPETYFPPGAPAEFKQLQELWQERRMQGQQPRPRPPPPY